MQIGIELLSHRDNFLDAVFFQHLDQLTLGEFDAIKQREAARVRRRLPVGTGGLQRAGDIVGNAQNVARKAGDGIDARLTDLALGPLAQVFHVRERAQQLVLHRGIGRSEFGHRIGLCSHVRRSILIGSGVSGGGRIFG